MSATADREVASVARAFEELAGKADAVLQMAGGIVACVEGEGVSSVASTVQSLCATVKAFMSARLEATARILDMLTAEAALMRRLSAATEDQAAIASQTKALSVLTNIEVARLGDVGRGFGYLAGELSEFSKSVAKDTQQLASQAGSRAVAIKEMGRALSADLPRLQEETVRIEEALRTAAQVVDSSVARLSTAPAEFKMCVEDIARQIAGVVAAIQAHDITRQQSDHVQESIGLIYSRISSDGTNALSDELPLAYAGLTVQSSQLKNVKDTLTHWASQIGTCMDGMLQVSASGVVGIGPMVLDHEREVSSQLVHIEKLQRESLSRSEKIRRALSGLSNLSQLVSEHLRRSECIRNRLRLLTFNSIIEASRLGKEGDSMLAIAKSIKEVSAEWNTVIDQSGVALDELLSLVKKTDAVMEAFSEARDEKLRQAEAQTRVALEGVRKAAEFVAAEAYKMNTVTGAMLERIPAVRKTVGVLADCSSGLDSVAAEIDQLVLQLEAQDADIKERYDAAEIKQLFSALYTTEIERLVLHAQLYGGEVPVAQPALAGNEVELF